MYSQYVYSVYIHICLTYHSKEEEVGCFHHSDAAADAAAAAAAAKFLPIYSKCISFFQLVE